MLSGNGTKQKNNLQSSNSDKPRLTFHCQLAHGSPTGIISGFSNVKELYKKISECYDMEPANVSCNVLLLNLRNKSVL